MQNYIVNDDGNLELRTGMALAPKRWGSEQIIVETEMYQVKRLFMQKGRECSMHYHERKHETVTVLRGTLTVFFESQPIGKVILSMGDCLELPNGIEFAHRMSAVDEHCWYLESAVAGCNKDNIRIRL